MSLNLSQEKPTLVHHTLAALPLERFGGLRPQAWLCVGAGYAREDLKTLLLSQGRGFVGTAVLSLQELCAKILGIPEDRVLLPAARQEVLRKLFADPRIENRFPELRRLKRRKDFLRKLDQALQSGRMTFAHKEEDAVYRERLSQLSTQRPGQNTTHQAVQNKDTPSLQGETSGENPLRSEVRIFADAYEVWMEALGFYDLPLLIRLATAALQQTKLAWPQEIWRLSIQQDESLEKQFWEAVAERTKICTTETKTNQTETETNQTETETNQTETETNQTETETETTWQQWHTLDDAAEFLGDELLRRGSPNDWTQDAILMPDDPAVRRSLRRVLEARGIPAAEPRDPTQLLWDESVKWALNPLEVVGRNFQRPTVASWIRGFAQAGNLGAWVTEINARGIRSGLKAYGGEPLTELFTELKKMSDLLGGRKTASELATAHLTFLKSRKEDSHLGAIQFLEKLWEVLVQDLERVGEETRKAPPLFWYEKLLLRLKESSPPVDGMKPEQGIRIYRLQQAPVFTAERIWILGLPAHWLNGEGTASQWYSEREREVLATEFAVRSSVQVHDERVQALVAWISASRSCVVLDAHYDSEGRERETILPVLEELGFECGRVFPEVPVEKGAHALLAGSYTAPLLAPPQKVNLTPLPGRPGGQGPEITATVLDRASRCSFQALAYHRWNLRDVREPEPDLWPDVKGNLLHAAVKVLLKAYLNTGEFTTTPQDALAQVWKARKPKGLIQSDRIERYLKSRLQDVLRVFCEKEKAYLLKSGAKPVSLDEQILRIEYPEFAIMGQPDRIDEFEGGYFVMDYKSSGSLPHGSDMLETGYRLQLPFYGVALQKIANRPVCGLQFIELNSGGGRKSGILFKQFNGKDPGNLTEARSNSKSLIAQEPHEVWPVLESRMIKTATAYIQGNYEAMPNVQGRHKECTRCRVQDLCGYRRLVQSEKSEAEPGEPSDATGSAAS